MDSILLDEKNIETYDSSRETTKSGVMGKLGFFAMATYLILNFGYDKTRPELVGTVISTNPISSQRYEAKIRTYDDKTLNLVFNTSNGFVGIGSPETFLTSDLEKKVQENNMIRVAVNRRNQDQAKVYKLISVTN